jgi:hypothetical protein
MAAKVFSTPTGIDAPDFGDAFVNGGYSINKESELRSEFLDKLRGWLKANKYTGPLAGKVVRWPIADGYAEYMVVSLRPLTLIHLPLGDAWRMPAPFERGLTAADIRDQVERAKKLPIREPLPSPLGDSR